MRTFGRYLKLIGVFAKYSLMSSLEYRINFVTGMTVEMGWMIIKLFYVAIIYKAGTNIGILTPHHILLFIGTYVLMTGVYMLYFGNFCSIPTRRIRPLSCKADLLTVSCNNAAAGLCLIAAKFDSRNDYDYNRLAPCGSACGSDSHSRICFLSGVWMSFDI